MAFTLQQLARTNIPGGAFFDLLRRFPNEPLAVLHSGHLQGQSVIARKPLITIFANDAATGLQIHIAAGLPPFHPLPNAPLLQQWDAALQQPALSPHSPLTAWIGQISYDLGRILEDIGTHAADDLHWPLLHWRLFDEYYLFDHATSVWSLITCDWDGRADSAERRLDHMAHHVAEALQAPALLPPTPIGQLLHSIAHDDYLRRVQRIKDYIAAGDIFQANFAQRWTVRTPATPIDMFQRLMHESPAPYAALLTFGNRAAISASPELLLHFDGHHLLTRPIKGTRPRDRVNSAHDAALHDELLHSKKDQAELAMIVDLLRNDLGRFAEFGSVRITTPREIEAHPTVWHAVASIEANLPARPHDSSLDPRLPTADHRRAAILHALWPGGSITGAPKIRAMQIIEELESFRRGLYCGAIGSTSARPDTLMLNIAIRTIQMIDDRAHLYAGGAIVADSDPEQEYQETLHKAAALFRALGL